MNKISISNLLTESLDRYKDNFLKLFIANIISKLPLFPLVILGFAMQFLIAFYQDSKGHHAMPVSFTVFIILLLLFVVIPLLLTACFFEAGFINYIIKLLRGEKPKLTSVLLFNMTALRYFLYSILWHIPLLAGILICFSSLLVFVLNLFMKLPFHGFWISLGSMGGFLAGLIIVLLGIRFILSRFIGIYIIVSDCASFPQAFSESKSLMDGHRTALLMLGIILGLINLFVSSMSSGIGMLFLTPWFELCFLTFYLSLKESQQEIQSILKTEKDNAYE